MTNSIFRDLFRNAIPALVGMTIQVGINSILEGLQIIDVTARHQFIVGIVLALASLAWLVAFKEGNYVFVGMTIQAIGGAIVGALGNVDLNPTQQALAGLVYVLFIAILVLAEGRVHKE